MLQAEARQLLEVLLRWEDEPALTAAEVDLLLDKARRADADGISVERPWRSATYYGLNAYVVPTAYGGNAHVYRATTAGISGTVEPTWPASGTVTDNTAVFTEAGVPAWTATWDLNAAAALGWRLKAVKVATEFDFTTDGQTFNRSQQYANCLAIAETFANKGAASMPIGTYTNRY